MCYTRLPRTAVILKLWRHEETVAYMGKLKSFDLQAVIYASQVAHDLSSERWSTGITTGQSLFCAHPGSLLRI